MFSVTDGNSLFDSMAGGMRLIVSCISSFLILSLLLFMVHRLRQRRRERIESLIGANREYQLSPSAYYWHLDACEGVKCHLGLTVPFCVLVGSSNLNVLVDNGKVFLFVCGPDLKYLVCERCPWFEEVRVKFRCDTGQTDWEQVGLGIVV